ncbi:MAG TPA: prealbumin-like fold domain-containing protein [Gemmatimonadaceae bacterium]|nr:prealbumin-like fold domain-containing protein [Gemmatimonadaceae bacterium]
MNNPRIRSLVVLALALTASSCDLGSLTGGGRSAAVAMVLPRMGSMVGLAAQTSPADEVTKIRIQVYRSQDEAVLLDRLVRADEITDLNGTQPGDPGLKLSVGFPLPSDVSPQDVYSVVVYASLGTGTLAYVVGPASFSLGDGRSTNVIDAQMQYVGPGSDAVTAQISVFPDTIAVGEAVDANCTGMTVSGAPTPVLPVAMKLFSQNTSVAVTESGSLVRGVAVGNAVISCELDFGSHDTASVTVAVVPPVPGSLGISTVNGVTETPMTGVTLQLRSGAEVTTGTPVATGTSDVQAFFTFNNVAPGTYTVVAVAAGFTHGIATVQVPSGFSTFEQVNLTPVGAPGETIIQVSWSSNFETDLDARLELPGGQTIISQLSVGDCPTAKPQPCLRTGNSFGGRPEEILIGQQVSGAYRFYVHNYSADAFGYQPPDLSLSNTRPIVRVFRGSSQTPSQTFFVPRSPGNMWAVFDLNGGTIAPVNTMTYVDLIQAGVGAKRQ